VTYTIPIRNLLALRPDVRDQVLLDYLTLTTIAREPGQVRTADLQRRWMCSQSQVSRRLHAIGRAGLADITAGWGGYDVHALQRWEVAA
jgi:hypothetical protein